MIHKFSGFEPARSQGGKETLPAGAYVVRITEATVKEYNWGSVLIVAHDISEGEYAGFWQADHDNSDSGKWRGNLRINLPKDDGSDKDEWTKRAFNNFIWALEESNPGYKWAWDEATLPGKELGVLYRDKEWAYNGRTGWTTEACSATSSPAVREGDVTLPKAKPLKSKNSVPAGFAVVHGPDDESDLPF